MKLVEAKTATKMLVKLRDANRNDTDLVGLCNETILIFRNLKKEEAHTSAPSREAVKNMREKLAYNMEWFAQWARRRAQWAREHP